MYTFCLKLRRPKMLYEDVILICKVMCYTLVKKNPVC